MSYIVALCFVFSASLANAVVDSPKAKYGADGSHLTPTANHGREAGRKENRGVERVAATHNDKSPRPESLNGIYAVDLSKIKDKQLKAIVATLPKFQFPSGNQVNILVNGVVSMSGSYHINAEEISFHFGKRLMRAILDPTYNTFVFVDGDQSVYIKQAN